MKTLPWVTIVLAVVLTLNPLGLDVIYAAFMSNEALSRNIWQPIVLIIGAALLVLGVVEWLVRRVIRKRARSAA